MQFREFINSSGYKTDAEVGAGIEGKGADGFDEHTGYLGTKYSDFSWHNPGFPQGENHPVVCVSWNDAIAFCKWLSLKERVTYRLPTEAEWEYSCRTGTSSYFWCGNDPDELSKVANVLDASFKAKFPNHTWAIRSSDGYVFTSPVGAFKCNPFGLNDMHGNVCQWCSDWFDADYYNRSLRDDPTGPNNGTRRVLRGGGFISCISHDRSAYRECASPEIRTFCTGFRVLKTEPLNITEAAQRGEKAYLKGDFNAAIVAYTEPLACDQTLVTLYLCRAAC